MTGDRDVWASPATTGERSGLTTPPPTTRWRREPSLREVLALMAVTSLILIVVLQLLSGNFAEQTRVNGDNEGYILISSAIRHWDFSGLPPHERRLFWGLPYASALVAAITRLSDSVVITALSWIGLVLSTVFAYRLWGGWIAAFFTVLNWDWIVRATVGGTEAPFMAMIFATFLAVRRQRWLLAALFGALSVILRPVGIFVLMALALTLLLGKRPRMLVASIVISLAVAAAYLVPIGVAFGNPLENYVMYSDSWESDTPLTLPYIGIVLGFVRMSTDGFGPNAVTTGLWVLLVHASLAAMLVRKEFRQYARTHPTEVAFGVLSVAFLIFYNTDGAWLAFRRYAIPAMPVLLIAIDRWLPKDRRVPWMIGIAFAPLAAVSAFGSGAALVVIRRLLGG